VILPPSAPRAVTLDLLDPLPEPARRYLLHTGIVGHPWIYTVRLKQRGVFRLGEKKPWMPLKAEQVYTTEPPGFCWKARLKMFGLWIVYGCDTYKQGHGHMFGKVAGLWTIFDARGEPLDQASMVRYLNEMVWFPTAFLSDYITVRSASADSFEVTYTEPGGAVAQDRSVTARLTVDEAGRLTNFVAQRYREDHGRFTLDTWATPFSEHGVRAELLLPVRGQAVWKLAQGDLVYADLTITSVEYNIPLEEF